MDGTLAMAPTPTAALRRTTFDQATIDGVLATVDEEGYVIIDQILDHPAVEAARRELRRLMEPRDFEVTTFLGRQTKRLYSLPSHTRICDDMMVHPFIGAVLEKVLGHHVLSSTTVTDIYPGESAQTLHTDDSSWPVRQLAVDGEIELGVLWALDDFTPENGATRIVPRSHRWSREDRKQVGVESTVPAEMPAGSALVYSGRLLHGGGANSTAGRRLGVVLTYVRSWLRQQENFVATCPPEVARLFPVRLQELVGYEVYPPLLGHIHGRHPKEFLGAGPVKLQGIPENTAQ